MLANRIRRCREVKGIEINGVEVKVSLYADDMTLFLKDEESLEKCISMLREFKAASGLEINFNKTKMMWLGTTNHRSEQGLQIEAVEKVKVLGIYFSSQTNCYRVNVDKVVEEHCASYECMEPERPYHKGTHYCCKILSIVADNVCCQRLFDR